MDTEEKTFLSKEKHEELLKELEYLKSESRKEVAEKLEYAKSLGDLSENTEYQEAREAQANIEDRILKIETLLKSAIIATTHKSDSVDIGTRVVIKREGSSKEEVFELVGSEESDIPQKKISNKSPLGEALFGKKRGDTFTFEAPAGVVRGTIIKVE